MRVRTIHQAALTAASLLVASAAGSASGQVIFEDTFNYATAADMLSPTGGQWTSFINNPTVTTDYTVVASGSGYIHASKLPPVQSGYTLTMANNRGMYHELPETLTDGWTISASMLITAYSRSNTIGLTDASGNNGYGFSLNTSSPNSFNGKGFSSIRKIDTWVTSVFVSQQGTQLGANAGGTAWPNGFALAGSPPYNTTDGIPYAPDAPFFGFTTFELSWTPGGVLTLKQDGVAVRTFTDTSFTSFSRLYFNSGSNGYLDNISVTKNLVSNSAAWNADADGNWSDASKWTAGLVPNSVGALASFGTIATTPRVVTVDAAHTVGGLDFSSGQAFTLAGPGVLTLDATTAPAVINSGAGNHVIAAPITLNDNLSVTAQGGSSITFSGGVTTNGKSIAKFGSGTIHFPNVRTPDLNISTGIVRVTATTPANVDTSTSRVEVLTIGPNGKLDLNNNSMVIDYTGESPIATIRSLLFNAYAAGAWNGANGIGSTTAVNVAADAEVTLKTGIGYGEATTLQLTSFGGQSFVGDAIVLRYTIYGDANLDGTVSFDDLLALAQNYGAETGKSWHQGDFDYNGNVSFDDLLKVAQAYGSSLALTVPGASAQFQADWALAQSLVPEPTTLSLLLPGALLSRRRR